MGGEAGRRCGTNELWIENYHDDDAVDGDDDDHGDDDDDDAAAADNDDDDDDDDNGGGDNDDDAFSVNFTNFQTLIRFKIQFAQHTKMLKSILSQNVK